MFGDLVRAQRQRLGLTQEELAEQIGMSVRGIGKIEAGRVAPRARTARLLADAFGLTGQDKDRFCRAATTAPDGPGPRLLPAPVPHLVGRDAELRALDASLGEDAGGAADTAGDAVTAVTVVTGMAGVGKTCLAVHWAHRVADRFPDGQFFVNLRGFDTGRPVRPVEALAELLGAAGIPAREVPADHDEAVSTYRRLLQGRRVLVVLDNARDAAQVRPLLPGTPGCLALVTSRDRLTGLVALQHARRLDLDVLTDDASVALLAPLLGPRRTEAAARLAAACGNLPLALRIAGARLADHPGEDVDTYVGQLRTDRGLDELQVVGDAEASVGAAFMVSYDALPDAARRLFRRLGEVPGPSCGVPAAAALTGEDPPTAARLLDLLNAAHLVVEESPGRHTLHDLLRRLARALPEDQPGERRAARRRLLRFYLTTVRAATHLLAPHAFRLPATTADNPAAPPPNTTADSPAVPLADVTEDGGPAVPLADATAAAGWLDAELPNLSAAVTDAAEHGPADLSWLITDALRGYLALRRPTTDWLTMATAALDAARAHDDPHGQAAMHLSLGLAHRWRARFDDAMRHLRTVESIARDIGWRQAQASAVSSMGVIHAELGDTRTAVDNIAEAITIYRAIGQRASETVAIANMAALRARLGDIRRSTEHAVTALAFYQETGNLNGEAMMLVNIGINHTHLGEFERGAEHLRRGLHLHQQVGDHYGMALAHIGLADYHHDTDRPHTALEHAERALTLTTDIGDLANMANAHNLIGCIHRTLQRPRTALTHCTEALTLARKARSAEPEIEALTALAELHTHTGDPDQAQPLAEQATALAHSRGYTRLEGKALTALAAAHLAAGRPTEATTAAQAALTHHNTTGDRPNQTRTQALLAQAGTHHH